MNCTTKSKNKSDLKYQDKELELDKFKDFMEKWEFEEYKTMIISESNQYISRRQCILAAIESQLNELVVNNPQRKIGVVLFDNEVQIIGDGQNDSVILAGDKLNSKELCLEASQNAANNLLKGTVSECYQKILQKLSSIPASGKTALGPGLFAAYGLVSSAVQGSKIILCTDGLSNVGFGSLDNNQEEHSKQFYEELAQEAKNKGIGISIITIVGEQCNIEALSSLVDQTGGQVTRVDPESLESNFSEVLKDDIIATNVQLKVFLHQALTFKNEDPSIVFNNGSEMRKDIGNVTSLSEISFQYSIKPIEELKKLNIDVDNIQSVPFQAQIFYRTSKGKFVRIISQYQKVSRDLQEVQDNAEFKILAAHIQQKSSAQILQNNFEQAKKELDGWAPIIKSVSKNTVSINKKSSEHNIQLYLENEKQLKNNIQIQEQKKFLPLIMEEEKKSNEQHKESTQLVPYIEQQEATVVNLYKQKRATHQSYK